MIADYCGARGRLTLEAASKLGSGYAAQPKVDGCYGRITTDRTGAVVSVRSRSGGEIRGWAGLSTGLPLATLHAELEQHTEAGVRAASSAGYARAWLFDVTALEGSQVGSMPYGERYGLLQAHQTQAEMCRRDPWVKDRHGDHHDARGRYCAGVPVDYRRFPVVPQRRGPNAARDLWREYVERDGGEGIVIVALAAPVGKRNAKRKVKPTDTLEATVVSVDASAAALVYAGHRFTVSARADIDLRIGELVEVVHSGWYEAGVTPRFARLARRRGDLTGETIH